VVELSEERFVNEEAVDNVEFEPSPDAKARKFEREWNRNPTALIEQEPLAGVFTGECVHRAATPLTFDAAQGGYQKTALSDWTSKESSIEIDKVTKNRNPRNAGRAPRRNFPPEFLVRVPQYGVPIRIKLNGKDQAWSEHKTVPLVSNRPEQRRFDTEIRTYEDDEGVHMLTKVSTNSAIDDDIELCKFDLDE
jgi:hypothetical protein